MANMRAKFQVSYVQQHFDYHDKTKKTGETLSMHAVAASQYPDDGHDDDNTYAKWSPSARLEINIANPALWDTFTVGEKYYVDFSKAGE